MSVQVKKEPWWCANRDSWIELDAHGRCDICGSDAVHRSAVDRFSVSFGPAASAPSLLPETGVGSQKARTAGAGK